MNNIYSVISPLDIRVQRYAQLPVVLKEHADMLNATEAVLRSMKELQESLPKLPPKPVTLPSEGPLGVEETAKDEKEKKELEKMMTVFSDSEIDLVDLTIKENKVSLFYCKIYI